MKSQQEEKGCSYCFVGGETLIKATERTGRTISCESQEIAIIIRLKVKYLLNSINCHPFCNYPNPLEFY
jgi:hypothetical protein